MNTLYLCNTRLPLVSDCDYLVAATPFYHADRTVDFHIMIYVTEGCIYVTEENTDYEIHAGELLFLKSGMHHCGKREVQRGTAWHYAHFYMEGTSRYPAWDVVNTETITKPSCSQPMQMILPKQLTGLQDTDLARHIAEFTEYFHSDAPLQSWNSNIYFFQLLTEIACYEKTALQPASLSDNIAKYLSAHYDEPFCATTLEKKFFLSYKHMAAVFKREKQLTMQQFHTQVRMNAACKLLRSTLLPIGEISRKVGYMDMLYFSRCFHAVMGMSPSEYRKQPPRY